MTTLRHVPPPLCACAECPTTPPIPPNSNIVWEPGCANTLTPGKCQGYCAAGSVVGPDGPPVATCQGNGTWTITGGCRASKCPNQPLSLLGTCHELLIAWWQHVYIITCYTDKLCCKLTVLLHLLPVAPMHDGHSRLRRSRQCSLTAPVLSLHVPSLPPSYVL